MAEEKVVKVEGTSFLNLCSSIGVWNIVDEKPVKCGLKYYPNAEKE